MVKAELSRRERAVDRLAANGLIAPRLSTTGRMVLMTERTGGSVPGATDLLARGHPCAPEIAGNHAQGAALPIGLRAVAPGPVSAPVPALIATFPWQHASRQLAVAALLVAVFLFLPLLQGFDLSAGQGLSAADPASAAAASADALAMEEVAVLVRRR
jgi:hypothetical protein